MNRGEELGDGPAPLADFGHGSLFEGAPGPRRFVATAELSISPWACTGGFEQYPVRDDRQRPVLSTWTCDMLSTVSAAPRRGEAAPQGGAEPSTQYPER